MKIIAVGQFDGYTSDFRQQNYIIRIQAITIITLIYYL
jgi:hypothetical protein